MMLRTCTMAGAMLIASIRMAHADTRNAHEAGRDQPESEEAELREHPKHEIVWMNAEAGVEGLHLRTFEANPDTVTLGVLPADAVGPALDLGVGVRFVFVTLGVRGRVGMFSADAPDHTGGFQLWSVDAELGFRAPIGRVEPYITLAGGYATFGGISTAFNGLKRGLDVNGVDARLAMGFDYYLTKQLSIGASIGGDLLFITRYGVSVRDLATPQEVDTLNQAKARVLEGNGTSVGAAWSANGGMGIHF